MLNNLQEKFEALTQREKVIVVVAILIGIWVGWDNFFYQPSQKKQQASQKELTTLKQQIAEQQLTAIKLENGSHVDPNLNNRNKLAGLKAEYNRLQELMMQGSKSFVPPHLMAVALSDILTKNNQLTLIKLDTLPVTTLLESKQPQRLPVYKHGLAITFYGSYLDTLNYLKALESLPWHFIWESIDYRVIDYPAAETTIRAYTLSFKESWLGV
ncbi:MAG: type II secretion system protein M [Methylobacter sp.]|jgi:MSHA biogenesis protein MshJ|nr:type II secretion system protein M [Methylobacter sp.]